jgi:hypothetical protein
MKETFETDFRGGAASIKGWNQTAGSLSYTPAGAEFTISKKGESPTIQSETYLFFGKVEIKMKASAGQGIISSIVLQSEDLDEVDWEFLGTDSDSVQMNYFGKGNTTVYDRMTEGAVSKPQDEFHTYALDWKPEAITWLIDGVAVRTLKFEEANGGKNFPQTPSTVRIGIWAGGDPDNEEGVITWAGGETDYTKTPFTMTVESVKVKNYNPGKEYKWTDKTGDWKSIEVVGKGDTQGSPQNEEPIDKHTSSTAPGSPSTSKAGIASLINIPSKSDLVSHPAATSSCTSSKAKGSKTHASIIPQQTGTSPHNVTGTPYHNSDSDSDSDDEGECECGTVTVTVTGSGPVPTPSVPIVTSKTPVKESTTTSAKPSVPVTPSSPAVPSTPVSPPPVITVSSPPASAPATSKPATSGLITDTKPSPSAPLPTAPVSRPGTGIPPYGGNRTTTATAPAQFTGAAGRVELSGFAAVVFGVLGALMV